IARILPFLLEEQLAEDITQLHIALITAREGHANAAAIRTSFMAEWLEKLSAQNLSPHVLLPETLLIPPLAGAWHLLIDTDRFWLLADDNRYAMELASLLPLFSLLTTHTATVICSVTEAAQAPFMLTLQKLQQRFPQFLFETQQAKPVFTQWCRHYLNNPPPANLLQGPFQPRNTATMPATAKKLIMVALCWAATMCIAAGLETLYFTHQKNSARHEALALYQQLFPEDSKIIDPVAQMKSRLGQGANLSTGFVTMLEKLAANWQPETDVQLEAMRYDETEAQATLDVAATSMASVNALAVQLDGNGLSSSIASLVSEQETVRGQLIVKGAAP
ncbi:MAG: hypothetical protein K2Q01_00725, partial [Rickettsiales bacterium]|nr:hypothetical protein [Rickettsiales bacterium]